MSTAAFHELPVEKRSDFKDAYPFECANCGYSQMANPSIMMAGFALNTGSGSCLECGEFLHLYIAPDNTKIISEKWDEHIARVKENEHAPATEAKEKE